MTRARHRRPTAPRNIALADFAVLTAAVVGIAINSAPHMTAPRTVSAPTAVEKSNEPSGHGGLGGPLALPSPAAGLPVWTEDKGAVVVDGQPLETPQPKPEPVQVAPPAAEESSSPAPVAAAAPEQPATGLLALVNADRADAGCGPVTIADDLTSQAQTQSNAQAAADQMGHSAGINGYDTWGENVAYGQADEAEVHESWMNSHLHRANILNCTFTLIGWASADSGTGVRYWTEQFAR